MERHSPRQQHRPHPLAPSALRPVSPDSVLRSASRDPSQRLSLRSPCRDSLDSPPPPTSQPSADGIRLWGSLRRAVRRSDVAAAAEQELVGAESESPPLSASSPAAGQRIGGLLAAVGAQAAAAGRVMQAGVGGVSGRVQSAVANLPQSVRAGVVQDWSIGDGAENVITPEVQAEFAKYDTKGEGELDMEAMCMFAADHADLWKAAARLADWECVRLCVAQVLVTRWGGELGTLSLEEFAVMWRSVVLGSEEQERRELFFRTMFRLFDTNDDNAIDAQELEDFLDRYYEESDLFVGSQPLPEKSRMRDWLTSRAVDGELSYEAVLPALRGDLTELYEDLEKEDEAPGAGEVARAIIRVLLRVFLPFFTACILVVAALAGATLLGVCFFGMGLFAPLLAIRSRRLRRVSISPPPPLLRTAQVLSLVHLTLMVLFGIVSSQVDSVRSVYDSHSQWFHSAGLHREAGPAVMVCVASAMALALTVPTRRLARRFAKRQTERLCFTLLWQLGQSQPLSRTPLSIPLVFCGLCLVAHPCVLTLPNLVAALLIPAVWVHYPKALMPRESIFRGVMLLHAHTLVCLAVHSLVQLPAVPHSAMEHRACSLIGLRKITGAGPDLFFVLHLAGLVSMHLYACSLEWGVADAQALLVWSVRPPGVGTTRVRSEPALDESMGSDASPMSIHELAAYENGAAEAPSSDSDTLSPDEGGDEGSRASSETGLPQRIQVKLLSVGHRVRAVTQAIGNEIREGLVLWSTQLLAIALAVAAMAGSSVLSGLWLLMLFATVTAPLDTVQRYVRQGYAWAGVYLCVQFVANFPGMAEANTATLDAVGIWVREKPQSILASQVAVVLMLALAIRLKNKEAEAQKRGPDSSSSFSDEEMDLHSTGPRESPPGWLGIDWTPLRRGARSFLIGNSYLLALVWVFVAGVSRADVLNGVFVLYAIVFILFPNTAQVGWSSLTCYCMAYLFTLYMYNIILKFISNDHPRSKVLDLVGLHQYESPWALRLYFVMLFFLLLQRKVFSFNRINAETLVEFDRRRLNRTPWARRRVLLSLERSATMFATVVIFTYVSLWGAPASGFTLTFLVLTLIITFCWATRTKWHRGMRPVWIASMTFSAVTLSLTYVYQFTWTRSQMDDLSGSLFSCASGADCAERVGLHNYDGLGLSGALLLWFAPFVVAFLHLTLARRQLKLERSAYDGAGVFASALASPLLPATTEDSKAKETPMEKAAAAAASARRLFMRVLIVWTPKLHLMSLFVATLHSDSFVGGVYLALLCLQLAALSRQPPLPLLTWAWAAVVIMVVVTHSTGVLIGVVGSDTMEWLGFPLALREKDGSDAAAAANASGSGSSSGWEAAVAGPATAPHLFALLCGAVSRRCKIWRRSRLVTCPHCARCLVPTQSAGLLRLSCGACSGAIESASAFACPTGATCRHVLCDACHSSLSDAQAAGLSPCDRYVFEGEDTGSETLRLVRVIGNHAFEFYGFEFLLLTLLVAAAVSNARAQGLLWLALVCWVAFLGRKRTRGWRLALLIATSVVLLVEQYCFRAGLLGETPTPPPVVTMTWPVDAPSDNASAPPPAPSEAHDPLSWREWLGGTPSSGYMWSCFAVATVSVFQWVTLKEEREPLRRTWYSRSEAHQISLKMYFSTGELNRGLTAFIKTRWAEIAKIRQNGLAIARLEEQLPMPTAHNFVEAPESARDIVWYWVNRCMPVAILLIVSLESTVHQKVSLFDLGKLLMSMYFVHHEKALRWRRNMMWNWLMMYFIAVMALRGAFHLPSLEANRVTDFVGLSSDGVPAAVPPDEVFVIVLLFAQLRAFDDFKAVYILWRDHRLTLEQEKILLRVHRILRRSIEHQMDKMAKAGAERKRKLKDMKRALQGAKGQDRDRDKRRELRRMRASSASGRVSRQSSFAGDVDTTFSSVPPAIRPLDSMLAPTAHRPPISPSSRRSPDSPLPVLAIDRRRRPRVGFRDVESVAGPETEPRTTPTGDGGAGELHEHSKLGSAAKGAVLAVSGEEPAPTTAAKVCAALRACDDWVHKTARKVHHKSLVWQLHVADAAYQRAAVAAVLMITSAAVRDVRAEAKMVDSPRRLRLGTVVQEAGLARPRRCRGPARALMALWAWCQQKSEYLVYVAFLVDFLVEKSLWSMFPSLSACIYAMLTEPTTMYWDLVGYYVELEVVLKALVQSWQVTLLDRPNGLPSWFLGSIVNRSFIESVWPDFLVLAALYYHRVMLQRFGKLTSARATTGDHKAEALQTGYEHFKWVLRGGRRRMTVGRDLYMPMLMLECLVFILFISRFFLLCEYCGSSSSFVDAVNDSLLPGLLLVGMIVLFTVIVADRIIYLLRAALGKYVLQVILAASTHVMYLLVEGSDQGRTAAILFLFTWLYLALSCLQLLLGYPAYTRPDFFTHRHVGGHESEVQNLLIWFFYFWYIGLRAIPFVWELRMLLDWSCANTSLKLWYWLRLEEIRDECYKRFADHHDTMETNPKPGSRFPLIRKGYLGFVGFFAIVIVLFLPLFSYSTYSPALQANTVVTMTVSVGFNTTTPFFVDVLSSTPGRVARNTSGDESCDWYGCAECGQDDWGDCAEDWGLPHDSCNWLLRDSLRATRPSMPKHTDHPDNKLQLLQGRAASRGASSEVWRVSAPARELLVSDLLDNGTGLRVNMDVKLRRKRNLDSDGDVVAEAHERAYELTSPALRRELGLIVNASATTLGHTDWVHLPDFYTPFMFSSSQGILPEPRGSLEADCRLRINSLAAGHGIESYWEIQCGGLFVDGNCLGCLRGDTAARSQAGVNPAAVAAEKSCLCDHDCSGIEYTNPGCIDAGTCPGVAHDGSDHAMVPIYFVMSSQKVPPEGSILAGYSIVALYTTFILVIGQVFRTVATGNSHKVVLRDMQDPTRVYELVEAAHDARAENNLELEEEIYMELINLLRAPDALMKVSKPRTGGWQPLECDRAAEREAYTAANDFDSDK